MNRAKRIAIHGWRKALSIATFGYFPFTEFLAVGKVCAAITLSIPGATLTLALPGASMALSLPSADMSMTTPSANIDLAIPSANIEFTDCGQ
jgi:hypothetical protein